MSISLRDLRAAKRALNAKCRLHEGEAAATCDVCYGLALRQQTDLAQGTTRDA